MITCKSQGRINMNPEAMTDNDVELTLQERLSEIDSAIEAYKEMMEYGEAIKRLEANPDYKKVISVGYFEEEASRITGLIVGEDPLRRDAMENIVEAALSIRNFKQYLKYKRIDAMMAPSEIDKNEQYRLQVTSTYAEDGSYIDAEYQE